MAVVERLELRCGVGGIMTMVVLLVVVVRCWRCFVILLSMAVVVLVPANQIILLQYSCTLSDGNGNCGSNGNVAGQWKLETNATRKLLSTPTNIHEISSSR